MDLGQVMEFVNGLRDKAQSGIQSAYDGFEARTQRDSAIQAGRDQGAVEAQGLRNSAGDQHWQEFMERLRGAPASNGLRGVVNGEPVQQEGLEPSRIPPPIYGVRG